MIVKLQKLREIDLTLESILLNYDENDQDLAAVVDNRERLLQTITTLMDKEPHWKVSQGWLDAVNRTQRLVELMQKQTQDLAQQVKRNQHGRQSVQQYKRFL